MRHSKQDGGIWDKVSCNLYYTLACIETTVSGSVGYDHGENDHTRLNCHRLKPIGPIWTWCSQWHRQIPSTSSFGGRGSIRRGSRSYITKIAIVLDLGGRIWDADWLISDNMFHWRQPRNLGIIFLMLTCEMTWNLE